MATTTPKANKISNVEKFKTEHPGAIPEGIELLLQELSGVVLKKQPTTACAIYSILTEFLRHKLEKRGSLESGDQTKEKGKGKDVDKSNKDPTKANAKDKEKKAGLSHSNPNLTPSKALLSSQARLSLSTEGSKISLNASSSQRKLAKSQKAKATASKKALHGSASQKDLTNKENDHQSHSGKNHSASKRGSNISLASTTSFNSWNPDERKPPVPSHIYHLNKSVHSSKTKLHNGEGHIGSSMDVTKNPKSTRGGQNAQGQDQHGQMGRGIHIAHGPDPSRSTDHLMDRLSALTDILDSTVKTTKNFLDLKDTTNLGPEGLPNTEKPGIASTSKPLAPVKGLPRHLDPVNMDAIGLSGLHKIKVITSQTLFILQNNVSPLDSAKAKEKFDALVNEIIDIKEACDKALRLADSLTKLQQSIQANGPSTGTGNENKQHQVGVTPSGTVIGQQKPIQSSTLNGPHGTVSVNPATNTLKTRVEALNEVMDSILTIGNNIVAPNQHPEANRPIDHVLNSVNPGVGSNYSVRHRGQEVPENLGGPAASGRLRQGGPEPTEYNNRNPLPRNGTNPYLANFLHTHIQKMKRVLAGQVPIAEAPIHAVVLGFTFLIGILGTYGAVKAIWNFLF